MSNWINLGSREGTIGTGDLVFCDGRLCPVRGVVISQPGHGSPVIRDDMILVEVITVDHGIRVLGAHHAEIGADLRVHWSRDNDNWAGAVA